MNIDSIQNGVVIDHITAGRSLKLYELLHLGDLDVPVALITNAVSRKNGRKDIIKIDADIPVDLDVIGYMDPGATVNFIRDGKLVDKRAIGLPQTLTGVLKCKNPRCITTIEQEIPQVFTLADEKTKTYRCAYCEVKAE